MTIAKYCAELKKAEAVPRSELGNHEATTLPFPGNEGASDKPTRKRSANSRIIAVPAEKKPIAPCGVKNDQKKMLNAMIVFEPKRSSVTSRPEAVR